MSRAKKVLITVATAGVLMVATPWLWIRWMEARRWAHLERRVDEIAREIESQIPPHRPLRGESIPGDAWDDYLEAARLMVHPEPFPWSEPAALTNRTMEMEETFKLHSPYFPALDLLRKGTRRERIRRARVHEAESIFDWSKHDIPLEGMNRLTEVGRTRARQLWREEKVSEAAELLLDLCRVGHDVLRDGSGRSAIVGSRIADASLIDLRFLISFPETPTPILAQIDRELKFLDESFPTRAAAFLGDLEWFGRRLLKDGWREAFDELAPPGLGDWRIGWSRRLQMTSAFDEADGLVARIRNVDAMTAADEDLLWKEVQYDVLAPYTSYRQVYWILMTPIRPFHREHRARLRLLRTAAHYRATGELLELNDPVGKKLLHRLDSDVLRIWSVGNDLDLAVPRR